MPPSKIIIDTDPGVDDVLAVLLALSSPELDVLAITITFGNTLAPSAYSNLLKIYASLAKELQSDPAAKERYARLGAASGKKTILAKGAEGPVEGEKDLAAYFHGKDGLSNISETHPHFTPPPLKDGELHENLDISKKEAHEVILDLLRTEEEGSVRIIALGPLTNLALALRSDPKTFSRVGEVIWMGGALDVPGNTSPTAEFNCFADPYAIQDILDAVEKNMFIFTMCPLDITTPHTIPFDKLIHSAESTSLTPLRQFTSAMLIRVRGLMKSFGLPDAMEMHDPVAVWYTLATSGCEDLGSLLLEKGWEGWTANRRVFRVERKGEMTRGMCVVDRRGTGEESFLRTESDISAGTNDKTGADRATDTPSIKGAARVVVGTPGSQVLEDLLLQRVFGH